MPGAFSCTTLSWALGPALPTSQFHCIRDFKLHSSSIHGPQFCSNQSPCWHGEISQLEPLALLLPLALNSGSAVGSDEYGRVNVVRIHFACFTWRPENISSGLHSLLGPSIRAGDGWWIRVPQGGQGADSAARHEERPTESVTPDRLLP